jgi:tetratricopeptide (TPR) repeat protein
MSIIAGRTLGKYIGKIAFFCVCVTLHGWSQDRSLGYLMGQGQSREAHGEFAEAEALFLEALRDAERPPSSPLVVSGIIVNLAAVYTEQARYLDAERVLLRALGLTQRAAGDKSLAAAQILWHLIGVYADAGQVERASPLLRQYRELAGLNLAPDSLASAETLGNLGRIYLLRGDSRKALTLFQKAVEIVESHHAPDDMAARALLDRAAASANLGHAGDALSDVARSSAIVSGMADPPPQILMDLQITSGLVYYRSARGAEAEDCMKAALQIAESHYGPNHPVVAFALKNCETVLRKLGKKREASICRERARHIMAENHSSALGNSINAFVR